MTRQFFDSWGHLHIKPVEAWMPHEGTIEIQLLIDSLSAGIQGNWNRSVRRCKHYTIPEDDPIRQTKTRKYSWRDPIEPHIYS
jgi:hypothetical protein